jgi:hypothetical protein
MVISKQFESFNLKKEKEKKRKLCTDEVGGVKMKKNEKKHVLKFEKNVFF